MHCRTARQKGAAGGRVLRAFPKSRWKGAEAVNPARSGRAPRSNRLRPGFPNWMKSSSSSSSSRRKRTRRTGGKEARRGKPARSSHPNQRGPGRREKEGPKISSYFQKKFITPGCLRTADYLKSLISQLKWSEAST
uniref:Uncharacterized protein n=1 Tax=Mustela putorius furo TaxID=9669 RepID=M3YBB7_MUSPF